MAKSKYYDIKNLLSTDSEYSILLGQRANGKSYQVKITVLTDAIKNDRRFVYLRRFKADITSKSVEEYFDDMPISKLTKGQYDRVIAYAGTLYLGYYDEHAMAERKGKEIGYYRALNEATRYKSTVFKDCDYIIYEEFVTDEIYLNDEPTKLQQFVSTVARHRKIRVFLVGNTINRVCPYFFEWSLDGVLKQKMGTIEIYHHHTKDNNGDERIINIAVEWCMNADVENRMFFGQAAKQIVSGEWDTKDYPKLLKPLKEYERIYELLFIYQKFKFVIELLLEPKEGGFFVYVYPLTSERKIQRILTDEFSDSRFITSRLDISRKPELLIQKCIKTDKVCFSDNLTGTDFKSAIAHITI